MSGNRNVDPSALDQAARTNQAAAPTPTEIGRPAEPLHVDEGDDVVEQMKRQLAEFEERDRQREAELKTRGDQLESERRARAFAEGQARDAARQAQEAAERGRLGEEAGRRTAEDAQLEAIAAGIEAHTGQMNALKAQYAAAGAEGDFAKMADVQASMAKLGAELVHLETGKSQLEAAKARRGAEQQQQQPGRQPDSGGGYRDERASQDAYINGLPPRSAAWVREHRERYFSDRVFQEQVAAAANHAVKVKGLGFDSEEYIEFVEQELGMKQPVSRETSQEVEGDRGQAASASDRSRGREPSRANGSDGRMIAAPAGGSVAGSARSDLQNNQVYLSREEREMARRMGVSEGDWAREKVQLEREGLIGTGARRQGR